jgi:hypothetical protein
MQMHVALGKYSRIKEAIWENAIKGWLGQLGGKDKFNKTCYVDIATLGEGLR